MNLTEVSWAQTSPFTPHDCGGPCARSTTLTLRSSLVILVVRQERNCALPPPPPFPSLFLFWVLSEKWGEKKAHNRKNNSVGKCPEAALKCDEDCVTKSDWQAFSLNFAPLPLVPWCFHSIYKAPKTESQNGRPV